MNPSYEAHLDEQDRIAAEDAERGTWSGYGCLYCGMPPDQHTEACRHVLDDDHLRSLAWVERYLAARDMLRRRREEG